VKLTSMTPPALGVFAATSLSPQTSTDGWQGKAVGAANAEAVDPSKTLVQGRDRGAHGPQSDSAGAFSQDARGALSSLPGTGVESARIRVSDERSRRHGELLLGRYRLIGRLGAGGFGTVWHAHDEQLDRSVALKRIPLPGEEDRERAMRESRATARLSHPAIVALYEATSDEDAFYLVSELVEGETLAQLIAGDGLSDEEVIEVGLALIEALEHAHARGVIHRDVKPQNVLVPDSEVDQTPSRGAVPPAAKLADFGGARLAGDDALTSTGDVFGTLAYMAPEQSEGHEAGPPADLYSLALVLYESLSGVNPVRGRTPAVTARRIGAPIEPLESRRRDLPRELTRAIDAALVQDPRDRGTLAGLHDALTDALERGLRRRLFARRADGRHMRGAAPEWSEPEDGASFERNATDVDSPVATAPPKTDARARAGVDAGHEDVEDRGRQTSPRRIALPRLVWLGCLLAAAAWQAADGRAGVSLLLLAAATPLLALPRRCGPGWLVAALAPVLGLAGLAGAFPALAGQRAGWRARAGLAALGLWWLSLAEPLLTRHLWLGPPSGMPPLSIWEASFTKAATQVVGATLTLDLLLGAAVWALASVILPWIVRGRSAALDVGAAVVWTIALLAAMPLLDRALLMHPSQPSPRGALLGAVLGCALAVCARALRGPV
jgi:eukaryotic-like serine/threonine-protein kinase